MKKKYDLIIIGMGPSSIFCTLELIELNSKKNILLIEKGKPVDKRKCPLEQAGKCIKCKPICNIIGGFSGAGAFSDGKLLSYHLSSFNKNSDDMYIGGKDDSYIKKYYTSKEIKDAMTYTDNIYLKFGADSHLEGIENLDEIAKLQEKSKKHSIDLIDVPVRHLGTEKSHELFKKMQNFLKNKIDMLFETEIDDLIIESNKVLGVKTTKNEEYYADKVALAVGVDGASWLEKLCYKYNIKSRNGYMDIGIRYELSDSIMKNVNELMYEGKFISKLKPYKDKVRTYCQNPSGYVTPETYDNGCSLVNGHSFKYKKSNNTNLALLVSYKFDKPFTSPIDYCFNIAKKANMLSGGVALVQRYGDFKKGTKTTPLKMKKNSIKATYDKAFPFDLSYVLDYRTMSNLEKFIENLNEVIPGFNNDDNLMYGPEIKMYGNELILNKDFMTSVKNLYSIGTGGGLTIGLMMASVSGVLFARRLEETK